MENSLDDWFAREILVHEAALMRYLLRWWPHRDDVPDLRQDIYIRVYQAAAKALPPQPKSLLFTAALNHRGQLVNFRLCAAFRVRHLHLRYRRQSRFASRTTSRLPSRPWGSEVPHACCTIWRPTRADGN